MSLYDDAARKAASYARGQQEPFGEIVPMYAIEMRIILDRIEANQKVILEKLNVSKGSNHE